MNRPLGACRKLEYLSEYGTAEPWDDRVVELLIEARVRLRALLEIRVAGTLESESHTGLQPTHNS